jgi:hypothetical protein
MSYEPLGKVKTLIDAMGSDPRRVWSSEEVAKVLGVAAFRSTLLAHTDSACRNGAMYRRMPASGELQFRLIPFEASAVETTSTGWKPPQMACTRPAAGSVAPVPGARFVPTLAETVEVAASVAVAPSPQPTAPPQAAPAAADASIPVAAGAEEVDEFNAKNWLDGDLDLYGLIELEDGGHRIQAKDVARLRRMIAWLPA